MHEVVPVGTTNNNALRLKPLFECKYNIFVNMREEIREYFSESMDDIRRVTIPKPGEGEKLGITVQRHDECVVVTRILAGGLADANGLIDIGDVILEINNIPIHSPEDLMALVSMSDKRINFLVKKTPETELTKYGIPNTPSLRKAINEKSNLDQRILCHVKALFDYDPFQDRLIPCPEAGLAFNHGDILAILNKDDANWWQAIRVGDTSYDENGKLIPSLELEEKRKAFVRPESNYTSKIGLCGALISKKKKKTFFRASKSVAQLDKAELQLYEEVTLMKPFRRKVIVIVGASVMGKRTLKTRIINGDPSSFGGAIPHTSRPKRPEEDSGTRYWFVSREDMEIGIRQHDFIEYGSYNGNYYGTKLDSIRDIINDGRTCVFDCGVAAMKLLRNSSEFMPYIIFLAAPGMEDMRHIYENSRVSKSILASSKTLANFERTSSIRSSSRRAKNLSSLTSLYIEEDVMKNLEESARLQRAFGNYFDLVVVDENRDDTFRRVMEALHCLSLEDQWVPSSWVFS